VLQAGVVDDQDQLPGLDAEGPGEMVSGVTLDHQRAVDDLVPGDEETWHGSMVARPSLNSGHEGRPAVEERR
jgi:hypothetical protein